MFLKSIRIGGILDIINLQHIFVCNEENDENDENIVNNLKIIEALMLVFDLKYDNKYNYESIINAGYKGESFVEVTLHQKEGNIYSHYDWLVRNELKLKRVFQSPKVIYINKKRCDISIFHQALVNLGFHNPVNNVCIHRILDDDVTKFCKFIGDDFWSMLSKVFEHDELIEMVERKAGVVRNRAIKRSYGIIADTVKKEIPRKIELRNAIYERVQMNKSFLTLFYIMTERRIAIMQALQEFNNVKIQDKKPEVNRIVSENHQKKVKNTKRMEIDAAKIDLNLAQGLHREMKHLVQTHNGECTGKEISGLIGNFAKLKTSNVDDFLEQNNDLNAQVDSEISSIKLAMVHSAEEGTYDETQELLNALCAVEEKYLNFLTTDEVSAVIVDNECNINTDKLTQQEENYLNRVLKLSQNLPKYFDELDEKFKQIDEIMIELDISLEEFETLKIIEKLIKKSPENVYFDYLGPVFKYLNPKSYLGLMMWKEIAETGNKILFKTKESLLQFMETFSQEINECSGVKFVAIDELAIKQPDDNSIHGVPSFITMDDLISDEIKSEDLKNAIFTLLYDYILVNGTEYEENEMTENFCIKTCNSSSVTKYKEVVTVQSEWGCIWDIKEITPIEAIQKYYKLVKEYITTKDKMLKDCDIKINGGRNLCDNKSDTLNEQVDAVFQRTEFAYNKNSKQITEKKAINDQMKELLEASLEQCENWNINELKSKVTAGESIHGSNLLEKFVNDNNLAVQKIRLNMAEVIANFDDILDKNEDARLTKVLQELTTEVAKYEADVIEKTDSIKHLYDSIADYIDSLNSGNDLEEVEDLYAANAINDIVIQGLDKSLDFINENSTFYFKQSIYDEFTKQDNETIKNEMAEVYKQLIFKKKRNRIDLKNIDPAMYQNLTDSLGKVREFSKREVLGHLKVKKRAYPLMNVVVIKILKDTVHNFTSTYNSVLSDFIQHSNLFFYTNSALNEIDDSNFSWNCFDITRLKSIDFVEKWKNQQRTLSTQCCQLIKAILLIMHIVNYISVFKFVIISEKLFEDMEPTVAEKLRNFLKNISRFVQIIHYKEEALREDEESQQPMDTSDQDFLSQ